MNGVAKGYRQTSKRPAAPMPPPMHIVTCVSKITNEQPTTNKNNRERKPSETS